MIRHRRSDSPMVKLRIPYDRWEQLIVGKYQNKIKYIVDSPLIQKRLVRALSSVQRELQTARFATGGTVELIQYPLGSMEASGKSKNKDIGTIVYIRGTSSNVPLYPALGLPSESSNSSAATKSGFIPTGKSRMEIRISRNQSTLESNG